MFNIEILISLNLHPVFFIILFFFFYSLSFVSPLLTKSISVKNDYKASCAILLQGQIETAAIFFRIHDKWLRGVLANLKSLTYKYVTNDLNTITKTFFSRKIRKI